MDGSCVGSWILIKMKQTKNIVGEAGGGSENETECRKDIGIYVLIIMIIINNIISLFFRLLFETNGFGLLKR